MLKKEIAYRLSSKTDLLGHSYLFNDMVIEARTYVEKKYNIDLNGFCGFSERDVKIARELDEKYIYLLMKKYSGEQLLDMLIDQVRYETENEFSRRN
jgi:hypothetical protein